MRSEMRECCFGLLLSAVFSVSCPAGPASGAETAPQPPKVVLLGDSVRVGYLCSRPEVDKTRIGATGMSMGSTRSWWLAAVDDRVAAAVGVACLTRYQNLIAHGELRAHGQYYFVYGLLKHFDTEGVLSLIAPRPFLALTGDMDRGSPADGIKALEERAGGVYRAIGAGERFKSIVYQNTGHVY